MTTVWNLDLHHTEKFVLLALADNANDEGNCYPSIATITKKCSLSEPTVHRSIKKLVELNLVVQIFRTGRSTIYTLNLNTPHQNDTPPQIDTPLPLTVTPHPPTQRYPTPHQADTHNHQVTIKEPSSNRKEAKKQMIAPEGVSIEVWDSFLQQRKKARAIVTPIVIERIASEAAKARWTLNDALAECAARGWRGFKAEWVQDKHVSKAQQQQDRMINTALEWLQESK
jgi:hypothetical protein